MMAIEASESASTGREVDFKDFLARKSEDYARASLETREEVARLKAEGIFLTSETVTAEIAEKQGLAFAAWLQRKADGYAEAVRR